MTDTRALLNRIAEFRKRLDAMPRINPVTVSPVPLPPAAAPEQKLVNRIEAASRTQANIESALRQLGHAPTEELSAPVLSNQARRLLIEAQALITRLRAVADDPLLSGPPMDTDGTAEAADPLAVHYRETAALTEAAVRYATTFPESPAEQARLCEGLEAMIDSARRRFALLASAVERRRADMTWVDVLSRFLAALHQSTTPVDPTPIVELAHAMLAEEPGRPLHLISATPMSTQAYLGGPEFPAPARFIAAHSVNCAKVMIRLLVGMPEWRGQELEPILATLLHDVGMMAIDPDLLASGSLDDAGRRAMEKHAEIGAEWIAGKLPTLGGLVELTATHHERTDGTGYPRGLIASQASPLAHLISAIDVYVAMCSPRPQRPALDPRTALTEILLMADRGKLDRMAANSLLALGFYPVGSIVEVADGSTALVLTPRDPRLDALNANKPMVAILADEHGNALPTPRFVDLAATSSGGAVRALGQLERLRRIGRAYPEWA